MELAYLLINKKFIDFNKSTKYNELAKESKFINNM